MVVLDIYNNEIQGKLFLCHTFGNMPPSVNISHVCLNFKMCKTALLGDTVILQSIRTSAPVYHSGSVTITEGRTDPRHIWAIITRRRQPRTTPPPNEGYPPGCEASRRLASLVSLLASVLTMSTHITVQTRGN